MNTSEPQNPLSRQLAEWHVVPKRDPQFRVRVWDRVAAARRAAGWPGYARTHAAALAGALALALVLGGWVGREQARARVAAERSEIVAAYVQSLDARSMAMP